MNIVLQRRIDYILGKLVCIIISFWPIKQVLSETRAPSKILVILLSEMGSLVLAAPMLGYLLRRHPGASLYVLTFDRNTPVLETARLVPRSNILTVNGESFFRLFLQSIRALVKMRRIGIDTAIDCELFSRISAIFAFMSGAKNCVGFHPFTQEGLYRGRLITHPVLYNPYCHISKQFLTLAKALTSNEVPPAKRRLDAELALVPSFEPGRDEIESLRKRVDSDFPGILKKRLVLLYPGGGLLPIRAWPVSHFIFVARGLIGGGYAAGVIGTSEDRDLARKIVRSCGSEHCIDLTGYTRTVRELMVLFNLSSLLITNDGGPGHFASMTPLPAILLFGPETPVLYGSLSPRAVNLFASFSCSPCLTAYNHRNSPCNGDNKCLKSIQPEEVLERAYEFLN